MMFVPAVTLGEDEVFVIVTSAVAAVTLVVTVAVLFPEFGSVLVAVTVAVFVTLAGAVAPKFPVKVNVAGVAGSSVAAVQVIGPVAPTAGAAQEKPAAGVSDTNVMPAGSASLSVTLCAALGPLFVTTIVYVAFVDGVAVAGPLFVTARSAAVVMVVGRLAVLSAGLSSEVPVLTEAEFVMIVPAATFGFTRNTRVTATDWPLSTTGVVQLTGPVPPTAGVVQVVPAGAVAETNVIPAGTVSVIVTLAASLGPLLIAVTV